jgi:hypothetical protein
MKLVKSESINRQGDERLESCLQASASHVRPDIKKERQASHRLYYVFKNKV